ncbi:hypothetical protein Rrhod_3470 [Rhodococcus rhodnii LMG 5362]|uniref:Uncharacterized protein n=1 Tax=Rhodococcus rhodnii LMG 5362 TaxID=1273125 RepID=R7WMN1_9NOCA|nr:hypothetical protein Rrhod_3470 [Rhodococcus rhodnii LMG 5362]
MIVVKDLFSLPTTYSFCGRSAKTAALLVDA